MGDPKDIPPEQLVKDMDRLIKQGFTVFVKFTCDHCSSRQTCPSPNVLFTKGYTCEECKKVSYPKKFGMMLMGGEIDKLGGYDSSNPYDWKGNNIQVYSRELPKETEREINLYLHCVKCQSVKPFVVTAGLGDFFVRKTRFVEYGSMCMVCFNKTKVAIEWSAKPKWEHFEKDEKGNIKPKSQ